MTQGDARSLIVAAELAWSYRDGPPPLQRVPDPAGTALVHRALAQAPNDPAIAWAALVLCGDSPGCDPAPVAAHFRALDPDNAAGYLPDLAAAARRSPADVDRVLQAMARASSFELYFNQRVVETADALRRAGVGPFYEGPINPMQELAAAVGLARVPVPALSALDRACREPAHRKARDASCDALVRTMIKGDTDLIQLLGLDLQIRRTQADAPVHLAAEARRRTLRWQLGQLSTVEFAPLRVNRRAAERLRLMARLPTEEGVRRAMLEAHHRPLEPPDPAQRHESAASRAAPAVAEGAPLHHRTG